MQRKQFLKYLGAALGVSALSPVLTGCGGGADAADGIGTSVVSDVLDPLPESETGLVTAAGLSQAEIDGLLFMVEEEKLAHDVYVALDAMWKTQVSVFGQIAPSETDHTQSVRERILAHGLTDPTVGKAAGAFVNAELQELYDTLVKKGAEGLIEALKVGCLIEEVDIKDLMDRKAEVIDEPDIVQVYDSLMCGSRNHLRAFNRTLENKGGSYTSVVLGQDAFDAIADSGNESCGRA